MPNGWLPANGAAQAIPGPSGLTRSSGLRRLERKSVRDRGRGSIEASPANDRSRNPEKFSGNVEIQRKNSAGGVPSGKISSIELAEGFDYRLVRHGSSFPARKPERLYLARGL